MKRLGLALAALAAITFLSAPVFARTTLANFPGSPQALEELLAHVHKHKHKKVVSEHRATMAAAEAAAAKWRRQR